MKLKIREHGNGAAIVRADFNVATGDAAEDVDRLKALGAAFINEVDHVGNDPRLTAIARTKIEEATMFAVKSATAPRST